MTYMEQIVLNLITISLSTQLNIYKIFEGIAKTESDY